jgi:hypothetical protein
MSPIPLFWARHAGILGGIAAVVVYVGVLPIQGQETSPSANRTVGRIDFDQADLPPATVEVELDQAMFSDLFGLGDAAIAGVVESFQQSGGGSEGTRLAAEQLTAAREIIQLASQVVREVQVRVYEGLPDQADGSAVLASRVDKQLANGSWNTVAKVRDGDDIVRVSLLRHDDGIRGAFVVAGSGKDLVLANVVCELSPENVKKLTSAATKVGLENGLGQVIEAKMREAKMHHSHQSWPPSPPAPEQNGSSNDANY